MIRLKIRIIRTTAIGTGKTTGKTATTTTTTTTTGTALDFRQQKQATKVTDSDFHLKLVNNDAT